MIKQTIFKYKFKNDFNNHQNFYINQTNSHAFDGVLYSNDKNIFLYGPSKSGKTFLSQIWQSKNNAIKFNKNFENIILKKNNIIVDDINNKNEEQIFHLINYCNLNNLKLLITSNIQLNKIKLSLADLSSRLKLFNYYKIFSPDDEMLSNILTKLIIDKQFIIKSPEILDYIIKRIDRSYYAVNQLVDQLDNLTLEKKRQLTIPLIKEIL